MCGSLQTLLANQKGHVHYDRPLPKSPRKMYVFRGKKRHPWAGYSTWQKLPAGTDRTHTSGSVSERSTMGHCVLILSSASVNSTAVLHIVSAAQPITATRHKRTGMLSAVDIHREKKSQASPPHLFHSICDSGFEFIPLHFCILFVCVNKAISHKRKVCSSDFTRTDR